MEAALEIGFKEKPVIMKGSFLMFSVPVLMALFATIYFELLRLALA